PSEIPVNVSSLVDISTNVGDNTLTSIMNGNGELIPNVDYRISGSIVTIDKSYLAYYFNKFPNQNLYLHLNFRSGDSSVLTIYTGDTPHVVITDALTYTLGSGDAKLNLVPNGNLITGIKNADSVLIPRIDYTYEPSTNTFYIRRGYLNSYFTKTFEPLKLNVSFTGDASKIVVVNPIK
ncbi:MAG TPA: X2-like carbohydrate binding domain-containing protein, partial [Clostridia bacterium]